MIENTQMKRRRKSVAEVRAGDLYDLLPLQNDGKSMTATEIRVLTGWGPYGFRKALTFLRMTLAEGKGTQYVTCEPLEAGGEWGYALVEGSDVDPDEGWPRNQSNHIRARLETICQLANVLTNTQDRRTVQGRQIAEWRRQLVFVTETFDALVVAAEERRSEKVESGV